MRGKLLPLHPAEVRAEVAVKRMEQQVGAGLKTYGLELRSDPEGNYSVGFTGRPIDKWHDISSAPKDGTKILATDWRNFFGACVYGNGNWFPVELTNFEWLREVEPGSFVLCYPTHWNPDIALGRKKITEVR